MGIWMKINKKNTTFGQGSKLKVMQKNNHIRNRILTELLTFNKFQMILILKNLSITFY